eukprot:scaffold292718_cov26-Prasinocladus_malaysianus.AAC.1
MPTFATVGSAMLRAAKKFLFQAKNDGGSLGWLSGSATGEWEATTTARRWSPSLSCPQVTPQCHSLLCCLAKSRRDKACVTQ